MRDITPLGMQQLADTVKGMLPNDHGFVVFAFPLGDAPDRRMRWISNARRKEAVAALKEWISQKEREQDDAN